MENSSACFLRSAIVHNIYFFPWVGSHVIELMKFLIVKRCYPVDRLFSVKLVSLVLFFMQRVGIFVVVETREVVWVLRSARVPKVMVEFTKFFCDISLLCFCIASRIRVELCSSLFKIKSYCRLVTFGNDLFHTAFSICARYIFLTD